MACADITVSIVSHRQNALVNQLLSDIQQHCAERVSLILTENVPDPTSLSTVGLSCPVERIANERAMGFGANHNASFKRCRTHYFCVANPDIRLPADPFPKLVRQFEDPQVAVTGPLVRSSAGGIEDSARRFPTPGKLVRKLLHGGKGPDYPADRGAIGVDWIAGMFMLFRTETFRAIGGFDESYFLYYEDVELCRRLRASGKSVIYNPAVEVIHDARRASRRKPRMAMHHLRSMLKFLLSG